jgi:hypothetical protein
MLYNVTNMDIIIDMNAINPHGDERSSVDAPHSKVIQPGDRNQSISQKETTISKTQLTSSTVNLDVQFPEFLPGGNGSNNPKLAKENFINFYNGINYLLEKYGAHDFIIDNLIPILLSSCNEEHIKPFTDSFGRMKFIGQCPNGSRETPFTAEDLHRLEHEIIKKNSTQANAGDVIDREGILRSDVPFPSFVGGGEIPGDADVSASTVITRENFKNYHTGMNYLVKKYGSHRVNEALREFRASSLARMSYVQLELSPVRNKHGQEELASSPDKMTRLPFTEQTLHEFENLIIENSKQKSSHLMKVIIAVVSTIWAAINLATTGIDFITTTSHVLSCAATIINDVLLRNELINEGKIDRTVPMPVILSEEEKIVHHTDKEIIARENFITFYNAVKYLVEKYGAESIPDETLAELASSCKEQKLLFIPDEKSPLRLADLPPDGSREKPFTMKNLTKLESQITGSEGQERLKSALKIAGAVAATAGAITGAVATFGAGSIAISAALATSISLVKTAFNDIQLVCEIIND